LAGGSLVEYPSARDFLDVAREQVDPDREPVLNACEFNLLAFEAIDDIVESFLGGDNEPERSAPLLDSLCETLEVQHPENATSDVLANLVDHEEDALIVPASSIKKTERSLSEPVVGHLRFLGALRPGVGVWVGVGSKQMEGVTRFTFGQSDVAALAPRLVAVGNLLEPLLECSEIAISFEIELEFRK
jgi:hypothetical protein